MLALRLRHQKYYLLIQPMVWIYWNKIDIIPRSHVKACIFKIFYINDITITAIDIHTTSIEYL